MGHAGHWSRLLTTGPREPGKGIPASDSISGKERADARVPPSDTYDGGWGGWLERRSLQDSLRQLLSAESFTIAHRKIAFTVMKICEF